MPQYSHTAADTKVVESRDEIFNIISVLDMDLRPISSAIGTRDIKSSEFSHLKDALRAANADNAGKQGEDAPAVSDTSRTKVAGYTQIFRDTCSVSGTMDAIAQHGLETESKYQKPKKMRECAIDVESMIISSNVAVQPIEGTTAGKSAGLGSILTTNVDSTTNATLAASQAKFEDLLQDTWEGGGRPQDAYVSGLQKRGMGAWTTKTTYNVNNAQGNKVAVTGVDDYWADIGGPISFHHHYMMPTTHLFLLDLSYFKLAWLRKWFWKVLGESGDTSLLEEYIGEVGLFTKDEASSGMMDNLAAA